MVDFVKFSVANFKEISTNPILSFKERTNRANTSSFKEAHYNGVKFILKNTGYLIISGSLHKYYNEGKHNYNDFTFSMVQLVIEDLVNKFKFNLNDCYIHNIEFGVNIIPIADTQLILEGLLIHKNVEFSNTIKGRYRQAYHTQYYVKVYNKANQYSLLGQLMRYELKFVKMMKLKRCGIKTLNDLYENHWVKPIQDILTLEWSKILMFDKSININAFNKKLQLKLYMWNDSNYWLDLDKSKRSRELKKYRQFINQNSELIQNKLNLVINDKWLYLSSL